MLPADREQRIINFLQTNKQSYCAYLNTEFNVHAATIRRDLHKLEQFNQIKRTWWCRVKIIPKFGMNLILMIVKLLL